MEVKFLSKWTADMKKRAYRSNPTCSTLLNVVLCGVERAIEED
jgi:hypothetical protein